MRQVQLFPILPVPQTHQRVPDSQESQPVFHRAHFGKQKLISPRESAEANFSLHTSSVKWVGRNYDPHFSREETRKVTSPRPHN